MTLDRNRPEILTPPEHPQACCQQQTLTVPPDVLAKTPQKHDYPSAHWRRFYARRTGAERGFATAKDPATNNISRGWCRLMGLPSLTLFAACLLTVRNQRILTAWNACQAKDHRRAAAGRPPKNRRRRCKTLARPRRRHRHNPAPAPIPARSHDHRRRPPPWPRQHAREHTLPGLTKTATRQHPPLTRHRDNNHPTAMPPEMSDPNVKISPAQT